MKKPLLVLTALFALSLVGLHAEGIAKADTVISNSQMVVKNKKDVPGRGYCNSLELSASVFPKKDYNVSINMVFGYRFNKYIFLGGGLGLSYLHAKTYNWSYDNGSYQESYSYKPFIGVPVFARAKFNFTKNYVSPFFGIDLGAALFWDEDAVFDEAYFLFRPHIGLDINVSDKIKPYIMLGASTYGGVLFFGAGCKF